MSIPATVTRYRSVYLVIAVVSVVLACAGLLLLFFVNPVVRLTTSAGVIEIELYRDIMPDTTKNFTKLVDSGFYDNTEFHRVIAGFMIQGGDPLTKDKETPVSLWGTGGPGYTIKDEFSSDARESNVVGTIAMANAGPNTGGSQFFINTVSNTYLDTKHPVFGRVIYGMDVVMAIEQSVTDQADRPFPPVVIFKAEMVPFFE